MDPRDPSRIQPVCVDALSPLNLINPMRERDMEFASCQASSMALASKKSRKRRHEEEEEEELELHANDDVGFEDESDAESQSDTGDDDEEMINEGEEEGEEEGKDREGGGVGNLQIGAEMEELQREYKNMRNEEESLVKNLRRHKDDDILKGQAVKNHKAIWDKTLELRFLLQKAFTNSNKLPQEPLKSSFCDYDETAKQAYSNLLSSCRQTLDSLLELQQSLTEKNPSIFNSTDDLSNNLEDQDDEVWLQIHNAHHRIAPFRNSSVDKWHRKTQLTTGAAAFKGKLRAFNQNISEQVASHMRDPSRMVNRMQSRRSTVGIFGFVHETDNTSKQEDVNVDGDPELIDDSEFYQLLLKEFFESCGLLSSETAFYAMKKLQTKKRKVVDRRASKSRKIRYNVHDKIVNFMAPKGMHLPEMAPKLFENLFGLRTPTTA